MMVRKINNQQGIKNLQINLERDDCKKGGLNKQHLKVLVSGRNTMWT